MKKSLIVIIALLCTYAFADVTVTFVANSSTVQGVTDTSDVTPAAAGLTGVDLRGEVQEYSSGANWTPMADPMMSNGGDYWELAITFPDAVVGTDKQYKFGFNVLNQDGTVTSSWEGTPNRILTIPDADTVLPVEYVNSETPPFTMTDNIDVLFRVNMSEDSDFTVGEDTVSIVGHFNSVVDGVETGHMWSPGTYTFEQEGDSPYYSYHMQLPAPTDSLGDIAGQGVGFAMYRFAKGIEDGWGASENLGGAYIEGNENRLIRIAQDTTIQWFYWNDKGPEPFAASDTLSNLTFSTDVAAAITGNGFSQGNTLLVKWGYGGTQQSVKTDTLTAGFGTVYSVTIPNVGVDLNNSMYYQYYKIDNDTEGRETYFNFQYSGNDVSLNERRYHALDGAADGADYTINDNVDSRVNARRMPVFVNTNLVLPNAPEGGTSSWTYFLDLRPAYYQVMAGSMLDDIQGDRDITTTEQIATWNVCINGPATGEWTQWGGILDGTWEKVMNDDGLGDDPVAGDSIYAQQFIYDSQTLQVGQEFKFGIGGGDNESGYGLNHIENLDLGSQELYSVWGSINPLFYDAWNYDSNSPNLKVELTDGVPHQFRLNDNYPNPFNPSTTVAFSIPIGAEVTMTVYNILGEKIATIYNNYTQPGNYKATWNGLDLNGNEVPTGAYLIELDAGAYFHDVKKMTLMK